MAWILMPFNRLQRQEQVMHLIIIPILIMAVAYLGIVAGGLPFADQRDALEACAKKHNVYRCEMVAVPVTDEEGE